MSEFQIFNRGAFVDKAHFCKLLELPECAVGLYPKEGIILTHGTVVVLSVSKFICDRGEVPLGSGLDVVVEAFVGDEVRKGDVFDVSYALDDLPLAL